MAKQKERTKTRTNKKLMLQALEKSLGVVATAAKKVGIDRARHYEWLKNDPEYKKAYESLDEMTIDFVESKLFQQIIDNDKTCIIFFLKTRGKKRGYVERTEQEINLNETNQESIFKIGKQIIRFK